MTRLFLDCTVLYYTLRTTRYRSSPSNEHVCFLAASTVPILSYAIQQLTERLGGTTVGRDFETFWTSRLARLMAPELLQPLIRGQMRFF